MRCRLVFLIGLLLIINSAFAQWHFSVSISSNSDCGDSFSAIQASVEVAVRIEIVEQLSAKTYNSQEDCEAERRACTMNYSNSGCYIRTTTTPCQGNVGGGSAGEFYGEPSLHNSLAIGSDYFSQNEAHNVENGMWENEMLVQNDVLNKNWYNAVGAKTGDKDYDSKYAEEVRRLINKFSKDENTTNNYNFISRKEIDYDGELYVRLFDAPVLEDNYYVGNVNMDNVQKYLDASNRLTDLFVVNQQDLEIILQMEFKRVSGFDVSEILNKHPNERTDAEKQILVDYGAFKKNKTEQMYDEINASIDKTKEKNVVDAAILALDAYGDDKDGYINKTNYKKVDIEQLLFAKSSEYNPIADIANAIKTCNDTYNDTGFHVELYYNEITNTYVISCAGTEPKDLFNDALVNDGVIALNILGIDADVPQYQMAKVIGDAINRIPKDQREQLNIEVVGHSLGGGMASIIGLETGVETKTFNAATVPESVLINNGLYDKVNNGDVQNITAYHTSTDILTKVQEEVGSPAIGISVDIGDPATPLEKEEARNMGTKIGNVIDPVIGSLYGGDVGEMVAGHKMPAMTREIYNSSMKKENSRLKTMNDAKTRLQDSLKHIENIKNGF